MGKIIKFEIGCRNCEHLIQIGKGTWMCNENLHEDQTDVLPIEDGEKTSDWGICEGADYRRALKTNRRSS